MFGWSVHASLYTLQSDLCGNLHRLTFKFGYIILLLLLMLISLSRKYGAVVHIPAPCLHSSHPCSVLVSVVIQLWKSWSSIFLLIPEGLLTLCFLVTWCSSFYYHEAMAGVAQEGSQFDAKQYNSKTQELL